MSAMGRFPLLSAAVQRYLCAPVTSISNEHLFSSVTFALTNEHVFWLKILNV